MMRSLMAARKKIICKQSVLFFGTLVSSNRLFMQGCLGSIAIDTIYLFVKSDTVYLSMKSDTVAIDNKLATNSLCDSDLDCGDESKKDDESLNEAYEKMYTQ